MSTTTLTGVPAQELGGQITNRLLRVVTRCATRAEFLATFDRFVDETSVFVATHQPRPVGARLPFAIALKDGEAMLKGDGEVIESHLEAAGAMRRPGMRLRLLRVDAASRELLNDLLERKRSQRPPPVPAAALAASSERRPTTDRPVSASYAPANETRVPGSSYVVPANPFGELQPEALEYFVECTLYEEATVQPPAPDSVAQPLPAAPPALASGSSFPAATSSSALPVVAPPPPVALSATPATGLTPPPELIVAASPRRRFMGVITAIIGAGLGLAGGYALWAEPPGDVAVVAHPPAIAAVPSPEPAPAPAPEPVPPPPPSPSAAPAAAVTPPEPTPVAAAPAVEPPPPAAREPDPPVSSPPSAARGTSRGCRVSVVTEPPAALVRIAGSPARRGPLEDVAVPCGEVVVSIDHPRYQRVDRRLRVTPESPARLEERLARPRAVLSLRSTPPGASFVVNGARAGKSPTSAGVSGFTFVTVKATLEGYTPWVQRVYLRGTEVVLNASLEPLSKNDGSPRRPSGKRRPEL